MSDGDRMLYNLIAFIMPGFRLRRSSNDNTTKLSLIKHIINKITIFLISLYIYNIYIRMKDE